jgi:hypothetical protein
MARSGPTVTRSFATTAPAPRSASRNAAALSAAIATSRPTPQFVRHHDVVPPQIDTHTFRPGWRVTTRLDGLLEAGRIDREQWDAACTWRRWAETVTPSRVQPWEIRVDTPAVPNETGVLLRVQTSGKLRAAAEALGPLRIKLLEWVVARDFAWREIGRFMRVSDKTARDRAVEALTALADWHAGRTVAPAPVIRFRNEPGRL